MLVASVVVGVGCWTIYRDWPRTDGTVVDVTPELIDPGDHDIYRPAIEYRDASGIVHRSTSVIGTEWPTAYALGATVPLYLRPGKPDVACVEAYGVDWAAPTVGVFAGLALLWVSIRQSLAPVIRRGRPVSPKLSLFRQGTGLFLACLGLPIAGISPGRWTIGQIAHFLGVWGAGYLLIRTGRTSSSKRSSVESAFSVSCCAMLVHGAMLRGYLSAVSIVGVAASAAVIWIGVRHLAPKPALEAHETASVIGIVAAVAVLHYTAFHYFRAEMLPPPWPMGIAVLALVFCRWLEAHWRPSWRRLRHSPPVGFPAEAS